MCEKCDAKKAKEIEAMWEDLRVLATGEFPEGIEFPDGIEPTGADRQRALLSYVAIRAALMLAVLDDTSPSIALGVIAGEILACEMTIASERQQREDAVRRAAPFN